MQSRQFLNVIAVVAALALTAVAHAERLTPEALLALRVVDEVALSPSGSEIVYRLDRLRALQEGVGKNVGELWRVSAQGGNARRIVTNSIDARQPQWSPSGDQLAWLAREQLGGREQIYIAKADGKSARVLTTAATDVRAFKWSPDGKRIAYIASEALSDVEQSARRAGRDWNVFEHAPKQVRLHVFDLSTRVSKPITSNELSVFYFSWSPDNERLVIVAAPGPTADDRSLRAQPYVVSTADGVPRQLASTVGKVTDPVWSSDGKWIAWLASTVISDPHSGSVFVVPASGGAARNLTEGFIGGATWLGALPDLPSVFVFRSEEFQATVLRSVDAIDGAMSALNTAHEIIIGAPSFSRDGRLFAVGANTASHPTEVFVGERERSDTLRRVTKTNPQIDALELGTQEVVRWRSVDGMSIEGVLVKPPDFRAGTRYPVVLHIHGGSESVVLNGWQGTFNNWGQLLAARGYVVLFPNYRGSRGRGVEFVSGNRRDVMGREWEDIERGLDHLIATGIADRERAGIFGFSWGGYAAGWGATYGSHRFKAAVGGAGIYNWISEAGTEDTRMHDQLAHWDTPLYENFLLYLTRSPIYEIKKANTPILLLHGEADESVPIGQAIEFHTALKWKGTPVELVIYPREGHGMVEYEHALDFATRGVNWLDRYLRPQ